MVPDNGSNQVFANNAPLTVVDSYDLGYNILTLFVFGKYNGINAIHYFHCTTSGNEWTYDGYYSATASWISSATYWFTGKSSISDDRPYD